LHRQMTRSSGRVGKFQTRSQRVRAKTKRFPQNTTRMFLDRVEKSPANPFWQVHVPFRSEGGPPLFTVQLSRRSGQRSLKRGSCLRDSWVLWASSRDPLFSHRMIKIETPSTLLAEGDFFFPGNSSRVGGVSIQMRRPARFDVCKVALPLFLRPCSPLYTPPEWAPCC